MTDITSYGNNCSNGNSWSNGNSCSDGNNWSNGNNCSQFNSKVFGSHLSLFCHDKKGICFMAFNQQADEEKIIDIRKRIGEALGDFLPYITNYKKLKLAGWHKTHSGKNEYVESIYEEDETKEKAYHSAWAECPKDKVKALIQVIKDTDWLDTDKALETFTKVTGISVEAQLSGKKVTVTIDDKEYPATID